MSADKFSLFADYFDFGMNLASNLTLWHESGGAYTMFSVVIREHDLVVCALYGVGAHHPMWVRPLREILHSGKWEWPNRWNDLMSDLESRLSQYEMGVGV